MHGGPLRPRGGCWLQRIHGTQKFYRGGLWLPASAVVLSATTELIVLPTFEVLDAKPAPLPRLGVDPKTLTVAQLRELPQGRGFTKLSRLRRVELLALACPPRPRHAVAASAPVPSTTAPTPPTTPSVADVVDLVVRLDRGDNLVSLVELRASLDGDRLAQDLALLAARKLGLLSLVALEGRHGATEGELARPGEHDVILGYVSLRR